MNQEHSLDKRKRDNILKNIIRFAIPLIFIVVLVVVIVSISNYSTDMEELFVESNKTALEEQLTVAIGTTESSVHERREDILLLSKDLEPFLDNTGVVNSNALALMKALQDTNEYLNIGLCKLSSATNVATMADGSIKNLDGWVVEDAVQLNETRIDINASPFSTSNDNTIVLRRVFKTSDNTEYMVILERSPKNLSSDISFELSEHCVTLFVLYNGNLIYQDGEFESIPNNFFDYISSRIDTKTLETLKDDFTKDVAHGYFSADISGTNYFFLYNDIDDTNWVCVKGVPEECLIGSTIDEVNEKTSKMVTGVAIIVILSLFFIGYYVIRKMRENSSKNIEEREMLFRAMSDHIPSAYLILRVGDPMVYFVSGNFRNIARLPEDFVFDVSHVVEWIGKNDDKLNNLKGIDNIEFEINKNGIDFSVGLYNIGIFADDEYVVLVLTDITKDLQTKQLLKNTAENAERASKAKTEFLSKMSHEIRTPLNAILGFTNLALKNFESEDREKIKDYIRKVDSSGEYLVSIVSDVLDVSRIEAGKVELNVSDNNLLDIINEISATFEGQMQEKGITFNVTSNFEKLYVSIDKEHTKQVLNNLISNSYKFTNSGGNILFDTKVDVKDQKAFVVFTVEDTGVGMSDTFVKRIFEPFTQEYNKDVQGMVRGSGLGMSICKSLIDLMNGKITVSSKLGKGSKFEIFLTFPVVEYEEKIENKQEYDLDVLKGKKILLIEDNELNREVVRFTFEEYGLEFVEAEDGQIGVEKFIESKEGEFYALFVDLRMPIMDGYEATKCIRGLNRKDAKTVPIFAMTADASAEDINKTFMCGMNCHITKPINPDKVIEQLMKIK